MHNEKCSVDISAHDRACRVVRRCSRARRGSGRISQPFRSHAGQPAGVPGAAGCRFVGNARQPFGQHRTLSGGCRIAWLQRHLQPLGGHHRPDRLVGVRGAYRGQPRPARHYQPLRRRVGSGAGIRCLRGAALSVAASVRRCGAGRRARSIDGRPRGALRRRARPGRTIFQRALSRGDRLLSQLRRPRGLDDGADFGADRRGG